MEKTNASKPQVVEVFIRKRLRFVSAQVVSCCVSAIPKNNRDSTYRGITTLFDNQLRAYLDENNLAFR